MNFVESIGAGEIRLHCDSDELAWHLRGMGARHSLLRRASWRLAFGDDPMLAQLLDALRNLGFAFVDGAAPDAPAARFRELVARGLLGGECRRIDFSAPPTRP